MNKGTRIFVILLLGVIIWLAARGRLADTVHAIESRQKGGSGGSGSPSGTTAPAGKNWGQNEPTPQGWPNASLFGLSGVGSYQFGENFSSTVHAADQEGLDSAHQAAGTPGRPLAHDMDYGLPPGSHEPVVLPGGPEVQYKLVESYSGPWGGLEAWEEQETHGIFEYVHLSSQIDSSHVGQMYSGGQEVGRTGSPPDPAYGYGEQLSLITDDLALAFLQGL